MESPLRKPARYVPLRACAAALTLVALLHLLSHLTPSFQIVNRLEWITYDWRARLAADHPLTNASHLGFVFISDDSIDALLNGSLGYETGLYWHRHVYGRLLHELTAQGAEAVAFDILLPNQRTDHPLTQRADSTPISSDGFFAEELRAAGNGILAAEKGILPTPLFRTNAWALGDISAARETDGILRRTTAFKEIHIWHPLIKQAARIHGLDLREAKFHPDRLSIPLRNGSPFDIPLDAGKFNQIALYESLSGQTAPAGFAASATPATPLRVWDLGIVLAAKALHLDLENPAIHPGAIILNGKNGLRRTIPVDNQNRFYIDWAIRPTDPILTKESIENLLDQERRRREGGTGLTNRWGNKLVVVGSIASGNDLTDLGATPLEQETYLTSRLWNVANSVLMDRFIREPGPATTLGLSGLICILVGLITWKLKTIPSFLLTITALTLYTGLALWLFVNHRTWIPIILPMTGLATTHFSLLTYKTVFEQKERRRVKAIFSKIVSPNVVNELLNSDSLLLGGAHADITIFFADIRGFTQLADETQARAEEYVRQHQLSEPEAAAHFNVQSQQVLTTVNLYLGLVADIIKRNEGTLDKYIGDCVMAFWGAPNPNPRHAVCAVQSAIETQRAVASLNQQRAARNQQITKANTQRAANGLPQLPPLHCLSLGTGINTGRVTVGLMGSHSHIVNYTVFGRDVNLASRLETLSSRNRILIGESTYRQIKKDHPSLAALCSELQPQLVKGFRHPVQTYEVNWNSNVVSLNSPPSAQAA